MQKNKCIMKYQQSVKKSIQINKFPSVLTPCHRTQ